MTEWIRPRNRGGEGAQALLDFVLREPAGALSLAAIVIIVLAAIFAPCLTDHVSEGQGTPNLARKLQPPSTSHLLGTDHQGRDLWARLLFGGRVSLSIALVVVAIAVGVGTPLGIMAGYYGGWVDEVVMRVTDVFLAFPPLLLAIFFGALLGPGFLNMVVAISLGWWPWYARIARGQVVSLKQRPYVEAARFMGVADATVMRRHLLPFVAAPVSVQAALDVGLAILTASALSFLGLGMPPPTPDWGEMVAAGRIYFPDRWWYVVFPGLAIVTVAFAFSVLGDTLRRFTGTASGRWPTST